MQQISKEEIGVGQWEGRRLEHKGRQKSCIGKGRVACVAGTHARGPLKKTHCWYTGNSHEILRCSKIEKFSSEIWKRI